MKSIILFAFCSTTCLSLKAQDTLRKRVLDIEFRDKMTFNRLGSFTDAEWNQLTPGFQNKGETDSSFNSSGYFGHLYGTSYYQLQVSTSLNCNAFNKRKITPLLGFNLGYGDQAQAGKSWNKEERSNIDTLTSSQTGQTYYVDSASSYSYSKGYKAEFIDFGINLSLQTDRSKRFSFIAGIGLGFGIATKSQSYVRYFEGHLVTNPFDPIAMSKYEYGELARFDLKKNTMAYVNIPIGVDFTIGNDTRTFWSKCVLGINSSVGYRMNMMKGYESSSKVVLQLGLTLKYRVFG